MIDSIANGITNSLVLLGLAIFVLIVLMRTIKIVPQKQVKIIERLGRYHRSAEAGLNTILPVPRLGPRHHRLAGADHEDRAAVGDHPRQRHDGGRRGDLLRRGRSGARDLRSPESAMGHGAADAVRAPQRHRRARSRSHADLARRHQHPAPGRARFGDPAVGRQGDADRAQEHRPAGRDPADDGEADDRGADQTGRGHHRGRREGVRHPACRGSEAVADRQRRGQQAVGDPRRQGQAEARLARRAGRGAGDSDGRAGPGRHRRARRST